MLNMTELENIITFFNENIVVKECVSRRAINKLAGLPENTLPQFLKGYNYRKLTPAQIEKLIPIIEQIGYKRISAVSS